MKSAIKALSSMSAREVVSSDRDEVNLHGVEELATESLSGTGRVDGELVVSHSEGSSCLPSDPEPEVGLISTESPGLEIPGQSKMSKIRSLYGDDLDERDVELTLFQERRYGGNPEVRPNLGPNVSGSMGPWLSVDNLPVPASLGSRFSGDLRGGDGERRGEWSEGNLREPTRNDGVYFSDQVSQRSLPFS